MLRSKGYMIVNCRGMTFEFMSMLDSSVDYFELQPYQITLPEQNKNQQKHQNFNTPLPCKNFHLFKKY